MTGGGDRLIKIWDLTEIEESKATVVGRHKNAIFALCKINEKKLASASCDKSIKIWDLDYRKCIQIFEGHSGFIWSLVNIEKHNEIFNDKSKKEENKDNIYNINSKEETKNMLVSASSDKTIKFWDIEESRYIKSILAHDKEISVLGKLNDGNIISGSLNSTIKVWKI